MNVTIVDYNSGNISSVINSFKEVAQNKVNIEVTSDLNKIKSSDKVVLPGQGSFKSCVDALNNIEDLVNTLNEFAINQKKPLLGICVGLQMFADIGYEETETKGLGWMQVRFPKLIIKMENINFLILAGTKLILLKKARSLKILIITHTCISYTATNLYQVIKM